MLIATADTPEEMRSEILKLLEWVETSQRKAAAQAYTKRDEEAHRCAGGVLRDLIDDVKRITIVSKEELTRGKEPKNT